MGKEKWAITDDPEPRPNSSFVLLEKDNMLAGWGNVWPDGHTEIKYLDGTCSSGPWWQIWVEVRRTFPGKWEVQQVQNA